MTRTSGPLVSTYLMLILPSDYKSKWKEKNGGVSRLITNIVYWKVANIRKSSGRVGEISYRGFDEVKNITLLEPFTAQKRWYKGLVSYSRIGIKLRKSEIEYLYIFFDPWILDRLMLIAQERQRD